MTDKSAIKESAIVKRWRLASPEESEEIWHLATSEQQQELHDALWPSISGPKAPATLPVVHVPLDQWYRTEPPPTMKGEPTARDKIAARRFARIAPADDIAAACKAGHVAETAATGARDGWKDWVKRHGGVRAAAGEFYKAAKAECERCGAPAPGRGPLYEIFAVRFPADAGNGINALSLHTHVQALGLISGEARKGGRSRQRKVSAREIADNL